MNERMIVLEMLLEVTKQGAYSHIVARDVLNKYNYLPQQEKAFIKRLFEGTLERQIELDYCIDSFSKVKTDKLKAVILNIMRMGVYQILYMDSVPDAAACNEAVKLAQKKGFATLKGFVNGVLRNIARNKGNIKYPNLSVTYSMPEWIVDMWLGQLGEEKTRRVLAGLLDEKPVTVRLRNGAGIEGIAENAQAYHYLPYAYKIYRTDDITRLNGYENGDFVVQDISSMLAVEAIGIGGLAKGRGLPLKVIDMCAAPGGKAMLIADILEREGVGGYEIKAFDISESKTAVMRENFARCGLDGHISAEVRNSLEFDESLEGAADIVVADLPCSGLGVIGKKRDIKYKQSPENIRELIRLQEGLLRIAVKYLRKGGRLLFSTCTINHDENERHFEFIRDELKMTPVSLNENLPYSIHSDTTSKGYLQLLPGIHDADGFFISVFEK